MSDYPNAIDYFVDESRVFIDQNTHTAIVLHGTGGNASTTCQQLGDYFRTNPNEVSVHYGIDRAGNIAQYVLEKDGAGGNGILDPGHDSFWDQFNGDNPNKHTISIEHVNDLTNSLPLTDAQKHASFLLIAYLCNKYQIPVTSIKSHASLEPVQRARCPGPAFPWNALFTFLQEAQMNIPSGWHDDGTTLTAPNGVPVVLGFREYILTHSWDPDNWPERAEYGANPVEKSHVSLGAGTAQEFRLTRLCYTSARGVYLSWIGQELLWYQTQK